MPITIMTLSPFITFTILFAYFFIITLREQDIPQIVLAALLLMIWLLTSSVFYLKWPISLQDVLEILNMPLV